MLSGLMLVQCISCCLQEGESELQGLDRQLPNAPAKSGSEQNCSMDQAHLHEPFAAEYMSAPRRESQSRSWPRHLPGRA